MEVLCCDFISGHISEVNCILMEGVLGQQDAADWIYRGEGAVNLVLAYTGSSPTFIGKVLRVQKTPRNKPNRVNGSAAALSGYECLLWKDINDIVSSPTKEVAAQLYVRDVMIPLLGTEHVDAGIPIPVSREFLESVERNVLCWRPVWRVDAAKIDALCDSALLISDHSIFPRGILKGEPCISVEIKPKCGFLPVSKFITGGNAIKKIITRFRMHQVLKLHQQEVSQISEYDPLDLFSGSKDGIQKAIKALFTTPQNNFRVFLNGSFIFGGLGGGTDNTSFATGEAFEDLLKSLFQADDGLRTTSFLQLVTEAIFKSRVLDRLLKVQKLDIIDIEGAIHAYYNIVSQPCMVCRYLGEDTVSHRYASLHSISLDESLKIVRDYLIAATAKDCSLMISFTPRGDGDQGSPYSDVYLDSTKQSFDYKACFIDLDMKLLKKMEYYYEQDQKIVSCYKQMVKTELEPDNVSGIETYNPIY